MTAALIPTPVMQFLDADGNPLVGGKVYTYAAGTSTPLATYTDYGGATPNANPVILNSRGEASIWFGTAAYKLELYTAANVLIWTADNVSASTPVVYGTGVAAALAINVGTAGSILVNGGAIVGTTGAFSGLVTQGTASGQNGVFGIVTGAGGASSGVAVVTGATGTGYLGFNNANNASIPGQVTYNHSTNTMNLYSTGPITFQPSGGTASTLSSTGLAVTGTLGVTGAAAFGGAVSTVAQTKLTGSWTGSGDAYGLEINHALTATSTNNILGVYVHQTAATASVNHSYIDGMAIDPPTISGTGTVTNANTLRIGGAPTISGGGTITNAKALWVTSGATQLDGSLLVGATSFFGSTFSAFQYAGATYNGLGIVSSDNSSGARFMLFAANSATCGSIDRVGTTSAVVYTATSDRRLKENIVDAPSAIEHINAVKVRSYNWIDGGHQVKYGVIAQEFFEVEPDAVVRGDDGETIEKTWAVDTSALVPAMIKALQELAADFQAYKNSHP